jgi:hypothetical protein
MTEIYNTTVYVLNLFFALVVTECIHDGVLTFFYIRGEGEEWRVLMVSLVCLLNLNAGEMERFWFS